MTKAIAAISAIPRAPPIANAMNPHFFFSPQIPRAAVLSVQVEGGLPIDIADEHLARKAGEHLAG
jgi:hypothetical protein